MSSSFVDARQPWVGNAESGGLPSRLPSLTGLRWMAALVVFIYHTSRQSPNLVLFEDKQALANWHHVMNAAGGVGVTFFFVLSGFILTWSARPNDSTGSFWRRRFVKIYPNYLVSWLLAMVLIVAATTPMSTAVLNLLMLHSWVPDFATYFSVDPPSWSLGVELVFYAAFPALIMLVRRIDPGRLKYWILAMLAGNLVIPWVAYQVFADKPYVPMGPVSDLQYWFVDIFPLSRMFEFALGILVARAVLTGRWRNIGMPWSAALLVASYALTFAVPFLYGQRIVCLIPVTTMIAAAAIADARGRVTPFRNRPMVWLGNISFAFYLLHFIVLVETRSLLGKQLFDTPTVIGILAVELLVTVALSAAMFHLVERPLVRRFSSSPRMQAERRQTPVQV